MERFPTILELIHDGTIDLNRCHLRHRISYQRRVDWRGSGEYSLDAEGIFRPDEFPTSRRIYLD